MEDGDIDSKLFEYDRGIDNTPVHEIICFSGFRQFVYLTEFCLPVQPRCFLRGKSLAMLIFFRFGTLVFGVIKNIDSIT